MPLKIGGEIQKGNAEKLTPPEIRAFFDYYAYADEFDPELPSLVFKTLAQDVDAARRSREKGKTMSEWSNSSLDEWEDTDNADEE